MRILYSASMPCQAGCKYCFAKWDDIYPGQPRLGEDFFYNGNRQVILYPCCDGEFFDQFELFDLVGRYAQTMQKVYVSISTKQKINDEDLQKLVQLNADLTSNDKGFVKFSISLSTKSRLEEIEPNTMTYAERLDLAKHICETGLPRSLILKPILPFISEEEYFEIINDFSTYVQHILLGGLYVNQNSPFFLDEISGKWGMSKRKVEWLLGSPEWDYIVDESKMASIRSYSKNRNLQVFDSDVDLIKSFINKH